MRSRKWGLVMAIRSKWTIRVESLKTRLRVGTRPDERKPQPVLVSLRISGMTDTSPATLAECLDYEPVCRWLLDDLSKSPHVNLIESRINEIANYIFANDRRVMDVWVGLYKEKASSKSERIGLEREMSRRQYDAALKKS